MPGDAELFDVEWQKGHDQLKAAPVKKQPSRGHGQVSFPVNGGFSRRHRVPLACAAGQIKRKYEPANYAPEK